LFVGIISYMTADLNDVRCASIRAEDLPALGELRSSAQIHLALSRGRAYLHWARDSPEMRQILVRHILPLPDVQLFTERGGTWYRLGDHLPTFTLPVETASGSIALHRALLPLPVAGRRPDFDRCAALHCRLVRDERGRSRPAAALRCPLSALRKWADRATSRQLAALRAAWTRGSPGQKGGAVVLVLGSAEALPGLSTGLRFWGKDLLIPLGFRADPELPESALRRAGGADASELAVWDQDGFELIRRDVFAQLERAAVRLAWDRAQGASPGRGRRP
jgi:hypothetical protein